MNLNQVTVEITDIPRAKAFYQRLGLTLIVSSDHYARFLCPGATRLRPPPSRSSSRSG